VDYAKLLKIDSFLLDICFYKLAKHEICQVKFGKLLELLEKVFSNFAKKVTIATWDEKLLKLLLNDQAHVDNKAIIVTLSVPIYMSILISRNICRLW
jgi:hypothetical protein